MYNLPGQKNPSTRVQYTQTDTIHQTDGPLVPLVGLVPIEKDVIPMGLLVNMHLIKGTLIIFPCDLAGYRAIPMVHWYQWYDWYQWKSTLFQWFYWWICISLRGLRLFSHVVWLGTGQFQWSIGTNGTIGTNGKWCHSNGSIGAKQVRFYTK